MKLVPVEESVGMVLCHDVTRIVPGEFKGPAFKKGHVIREEDIPKLLDLGKINIYTYELGSGWVHEDDAAQRIALAAVGAGLRLTAPAEGRVNLVAAARGLLKVQVEALNAINAIEEIIFSTLHTNQLVDPDRVVAGTRIIPLVTTDAKVRQVEEVCRLYHPVIDIRPLRPRPVGIITTGSEVYHGRIEDKFGPVLHRKFAALGCQVLRQVFVPDDLEMTVQMINELLEAGAELIAVTGGMSVDPDDLTPASIKAAGGQVVIYGAPVLPGAMFMLAYLGEVPILGLPGCVMYHQASILDLVLPRLLAGEVLTRADFTVMGHGGLCSNCTPCRFERCAFGRGG